MSKKVISTSTVHKIPTDLRKFLAANLAALVTWENITPLARNEWICWIESVKKQETRKQHLKRAIEELEEGKRRPCCWIGCIHRADRSVSPSQKYILTKQLKRTGEK